MDEFKLFYSVLRYIPSSIRMESINVGIVIHAPSISFSHFYKLQNTRRVASFDDEYDKDFFKITMDSLRFDLNYPVDNDLSTESIGYENRFAYLNDDSFLSRQTSFLSNEFQFSPVQAIQTNHSTIRKDIDELKKTFLYYDRPKSERITKLEVKKILSKNLRSYNLSNLERNPDIASDFSDEPIFDFKVGDKYIKAISFDYAHAATMATELKSTLYDVNKVVTENLVQEIIITTNDTSKVDLYKSFLNKLNSLSKTSKDSKIQLVQLSEFYQTLNR
ncbi:hypothetical protein Nizo2535_3059 [Lactiplantibacillus plantarum]|uniref:DUF3037 domain-containing protein n=1 Tax=Lactiplantibacillus plantarum TaxID=1590 RepID=UPI0007B55279|nr:DUF3037 domain-containing protein [Lactiplantibacillus plantarum]KZU26743.1 hypothetical protein Nizo2535_3059 [Lactiplantibacillus plantarum]KZU81423.1 hypothetical protein Nizo2891_0460 [Lactiplantibacillus plantarum]MDX3785475.1 DUF3037 domain-containing protein [Lactiplantibacillus plantarum]MDX3811347.1 DUF3037 domain-containing protein [Lactiplantibacillus plantarum]MDX3856461.1 DUF3037 domain-containing protein [Lactiplantibacillus plantarum]